MDTKELVIKAIRENGDKIAKTQIPQMTNLIMEVFEIGFNAGFESALKVSGLDKVINLSDSTNTAE